MVETWRSCCCCCCCCLRKKERKKGLEKSFWGEGGVKTFRGLDRLTREMIRRWRMIEKRGGDCGVWCDVIGDCVMRQRLIILFVFDWWSTWHGGWATCVIYLWETYFIYDKFYAFYTFTDTIFLLEIKSCWFYFFFFFVFLEFRMGRWFLIISDLWLLNQNIN